MREFILSYIRENPKTFSVMFLLCLIGEFFCDVGLVIEHNFVPAIVIGILIVWVCVFSLTVKARF